MSMLYSPAPVATRSPFYCVNEEKNANANTNTNANANANTRPTATAKLKHKHKHTSRFSSSTSPASSVGSTVSSDDDDDDEDARRFSTDDVRSAEEEILSSLARTAMHRVLSAATSATFADGDWKERKRAVHESVYERKTPTAFSIIARAMVPCTIDEISNVLSSEDSDQLNASMIEILGDQFGYAINVRSVPTMRSATLYSDLSVKFLSFGRRGRLRLPRSTLSSSSSSSSSSTHKASKRSVTILDYVETDRELRTACRVIQTIRRTEDLAAVADPQSILGDAFSGYVLREDPATKHTIVFFYGTHFVKCDTSSDQNKKTAKLRQSTIETLRKMTRVTTKWVNIARHRRLGAQRILHNANAARLSASSSSLRTLSSCCFTCDQPFKPLLRKKHFCCLCGYFMCGSCSSAEDVEERIGIVQKLRVCVDCLAKVNQRAFDHHHHKNMSKKL